MKKSETDKETYESVEDLKCAREYDSNFPIVNILNDVNEKETNDPAVQSMFKRSKHGNISVFIIGHKNYELLKRIFRPSCIIDHFF